MTEDRFIRLKIMLGEDACEKLRNAKVAVVGLGAVGSYAVEGLARAGIGSLRLVDFDKISPSNINRQLFALESTIGLPKCEVARKRVLDINPKCNVEAVQGFVDASNVWELVGEPDLVIDAIDALNPKVDLLQAVRTKGIAVVSSLGAALRMDPTKIRIANLDKVHHCPLGREVRSRLRRRGVDIGFPCVYSEEPLPNPLPIAPPASALGEDEALKRGRERNTLGSMPTITGMFGLAAANQAIKMIIGIQ